MLDDPEQLPLWLFHAWDEASSALKDPDARVDKQLQFVEALAEYLGVSFVATLLADRSLADADATARIAGTSRSLWGKASAFGDWVALVRAGMSAGSRLCQIVCGAAAEPTFGPRSSAFVLAPPTPGGPAGDVRLTAVLERVVQLRNGRAHGRHSGPPSAELAPLLGAVLNELVDALPALRARPLCYIEHVSVGKAGVVVHYRPLCGDGRKSLRQHTLSVSQQASSWTSHALAFWDGRSAMPTELPEWLARYDADTHQLRFCHGTTKRPNVHVFHSRQRNVQPVDVPGMSGTLAEALGMLSRPPESPIHRDRQDPDATYLTVYRSARKRRGGVSKSDRAMLAALGESLSLPANRLAELERAADLDDRPAPSNSCRPRRLRRVLAVLMLLVAGAAAAWGFGLVPTPIRFEVFDTHLEIPTPSDAASRLGLDPSFFQGAWTWVTDLTSGSAAAPTPIEASADPPAASPPPTRVTPTEWRAERAEPRADPAPPPEPVADTPPDEVEETEPPPAEEEEVEAPAPDAEASNDDP
jgi:hypothetical protein